VAYDLVGDPEVRRTIVPLVTLLLDFLRGHNWSVTMPDGSISIMVREPNRSAVELFAGRPARKFPAVKFMH
jgi:hypothetical protein